MLATKLLSAVAIRAEIMALMAEFSALGQGPIKTSFDLNPAVASRILNGEDFDVAITNPWHVSELIEHGKASSRESCAIGTGPARNRHS